MNVGFHEDALKDACEAFNYYNEISPGLAQGFEDELAKTVAGIKARPLRHHLTQCGCFRRANLKRFPYCILYEVNEAEDWIRIIVIRHDRREPGYGMDRT